MAETTHEIFCVKCKKKVAVPESATRIETTGNGRRMMKGKCPECGTNVNRIMGKEAQ